jgi:UDP-N-acetylmuramyl pentapeptide phosphotransferase/UDP-N-acetylglucosamine-1-phosphate transferase
MGDASSLSLGVLAASAAITVTRKFIVTRTTTLVFLIDAVRLHASPSITQIKSAALNVTQHPGQPPSEFWPQPTYGAE